MEDHPRIRGEHPHQPVWWGPHPGSSPHTRGAQIEPASRKGLGRIIPAYAGSTNLWQIIKPQVADHPRIRGEHAVAVVKFAWEGGSSPHTRGARSGDERVDRHGRIIPAYAGSTARWTTANCPPGDHPRIRGEHRRPASQANRLCWIIPAYAGSTTCPGRSGCTAKDHPRIRGEHQVSNDTDESGLGSSPHTRGALLNGRRFSRWCGIIPAYAGSTVRCPA